MSLRKRLVAALVTMALVPGLSLGMTETAAARGGGFSGGHFGGGSVVATLEVVSAAGTSRDPISAVDGGISEDSAALPALAPLRQRLDSTMRHSSRPIVLRISSASTITTTSHLSASG